MRVAVCLSGVPRNWEQTLRHLKKYIVDPLNADTFVHIWDLPDAQEKYGHIECYDMTREILDPTVMLIENEDVVKDWPWLGLRMFYKTWRADQLRRNFEECHGFKYDVVIKTREDLEFFREIDEMELQLLDDNTIIIPEGFDYYGIGDQFAIGTSETMTKYATMFTGMPKWGQFDPEKFLLSWLKEHKLDIMRIPHLFNLRGQTTESLGASIHSRAWKPKEKE